MADDSGKDKGAASRAVRSVISAVRVQDSELKRWRRTFDSNAKVVENGEKYVRCIPLLVSDAYARPDFLTPSSL